MTQPVPSTTPATPVPPPPVSHNHYSIIPGAPDSPEIQQRQQQDEAGWSHSRPNSVLIACIGNHWMPGAWQHVADMMKFSLDQGIYVELMEVQDRCFEYADALGVMRNEAIFQAQLRGLEWVLMVDNDIWPPADTLVRLLARHAAQRANVLVPFIVEQGTGFPLHGPHQAPNTGFHWVKWSVLSLLLMKTCIFRRYDSEFWNTAIGADEGYHFQQLYRDGYYLGMDTDLLVSTLRRPRYPLATNHFTEDEKREHWHFINEQRKQAPDRRPIERNNPYVDPQGNYNPFMEVSKEQPQADTAKPQEGPVLDIS